MKYLSINGLGFSDRPMIGPAPGISLNSVKELSGVFTRPSGRIPKCAGDETQLIDWQHFF